MDVCRPSSDSRRSASKKVPHKVLLVGRQAQQYRVLLANKQKTQAVKLAHKNVLSHPAQQMPHMNSHMRPPAPVYRAGVPQMPVRYMTTPNGMSVCTSPHQMMTDEIHTFPHMPSNYEYPDGSHLANGRYHNLEDGPPRYYHMVEQYDKQPRWESHPQNPRMYENTGGPNGFTPRMPAPKQYVQRGGQIYDQAQPFLDAYDQHRQQMSQMEYNMRNEASQQGYYDDQESVPSSPVKFLKSGNSTPGQKRRSYDEPHTEEEYENRQVEKARPVRQNNVEQKLKNQKDTNMNCQQRNEEIRNQSEDTLDFRVNAKTKVEEQYHQKQDQFQEKIYDSHPNPRNMPQNRSETPDDCFPPPPRSTSTTNFEQQQNRHTSTQNWQPTYNPNPKMVLHKDSYENTLERAHCPQEPENSKAPPSAPPRPAQNKNTHVDSSKQFKPVAEQRKQVNPPTRGYAQNLQQVELNPVKHVSTEKKELENWSQLVPHSKVAAVVQMLNQKEATNGIFPTGTQTKNKQPQSGSTPQLQRAITQKSQFVPPSTPQRPPNQESFTSKHQEIINQNRESPPHLQQESPQLPPKQAMLQRNQHSNFVPYNQQTQVQQVYPHQQRGQQETNMFQQQQQYYHEDQHDIKQRLQQKPIPQHRNSTVEDYHKESPRMARNQNERIQQEPAKVSNNPPPAPPLPEGGVLKPSASRKNSLNPSASNVDLPNANIKNRNTQQSQNSHEAKSTGTVSISTDSALSSDDYTNGSNKPSIQGDSTLESTHDLNTEAELLLHYFKNNQHVLNYLGIGIPDDLWQHIRALPDKKVKLKVYEEKPTGNRKNPRTQGGKVVRTVSSRGRVDKLEKRNRRKSNLQMRQEDERKRDSFLAGQAVAFGNAVISISKGPYPGYAGQEEVEKVMPKIPPPPLLMDKRSHPEMKATEKQIVRDFNDLSRQMNASDTSIILHKDGTFPRIKLEHRPHPPINRNISMDSLTEDELLKQSNDELEDRRSLKHDITDGEGESNAKWNFLKKSGRFVKKSAAALIAKKQNSNNNSPVPTMKVANVKTSSIPRKPFPEFKHAEYRIAEEIANLREREDELRRNRNALGLPSLDDIVDTWRHGQDGPRMVPHPRHRYHYEEIQGSPLRGAQSFDHLHIRVQEGKQDFDEYDGTGYTIGPKVAKSESFHHLHSHMDEYYYEKNGHREQHYGTDQFTKQSRARRPPEPIQNMDAHTFADRVKMQTQDPRFQKAEQIKQINIKIHPAKRPERSDTLDSNRTAESRRSMRSGNSSQKKKRFFTYAMPVMRL